MSSGLYRTFKSNYVPYYPDGRGRDRYIAYNNAGFFKDFQNSANNKDIYRTGSFFGTKIITHLKSSSIKAPNFHYYANGNGRDKYILENGGGLFSIHKPLITYKLTDFLRKNEENISPNKKKLKSCLSKDEIKYNKLLREKEKDLIKRLYINSKKKILKRPKINFKSFFSCDKIHTDSKDNKNETSIHFISSYNKNNIEINNNLSKEKIKENSFLTPRYRLQKNKDFNNFFISENKDKIKKNKPKLIIDAKINNKIGDYSNNIISSENTEIINKNNFVTDLERMKKYYLRKKFLNNRKPNLIDIKNSQST